MRQLRLVVQHLLKVRDVPPLVRRVSAERTRDEIINVMSVNADKSNDGLIKKL